MFGVVVASSFKQTGGVILHAARRGAALLLPPPSPGGPAPLPAAAAPAPAAGRRGGPRARSLRPAACSVHAYGSLGATDSVTWPFTTTALNPIQSRSKTSIINVIEHISAFTPNQPSIQQTNTSSAALAVRTYYHKVQPVCKLQINEHSHSNAALEYRARNKSLSKESDQVI